MARRYGESVSEAWNDLTLLERGAILEYSNEDARYAKLKWFSLPGSIRIKLAGRF